MQCEQAKPVKVGFEITGINAVARWWFWTDHYIFNKNKVFLPDLLK
jgi:hypothetical protein